MNPANKRPGKKGKKNGKAFNRPQDTNASVQRDEKLPNDVEKPARDTNTMEENAISLPTEGPAICSSEMATRNTASMVPQQLSTHASSSPSHVNKLRTRCSNCNQNNTLLELDMKKMQDELDKKSVECTLLMEKYHKLELDLQKVNEEKSNLLKQIDELNKEQQNLCANQMRDDAVNETDLKTGDAWDDDVGATPEDMEWDQPQETSLKEDDVKKSQSKCYERENTSWLQSTSHGVQKKKEDIDNTRHQKHGNDRSYTNQMSQPTAEASFKGKDKLHPHESEASEGASAHCMEYDKSSDKGDNRRTSRSKPSRWNSSKSPSGDRREQSGDRRQYYNQHDYQRQPNRNTDGERNGRRQNRGDDRRQQHHDFELTEKFGDLFEAPGDHSLAHCVAEDLRMGSGIAVTFRSTFKCVEELLGQRKRVGDVAVLEDKGRFIYYLITKKYSNGKPFIEDLESSLCHMKDHCISYGVKNLSMPRIGCGLDRLEWSEVKYLLKRLFSDTGINITVYNFNQEHDPSALPPKRSQVIVKQEVMNLVTIGAYTGVIYFGTEDSHVTEGMQQLDQKFHFLHEYRKEQKPVGDVVRVVRKDYYLYGLIINKNQYDSFSYPNLGECLLKLLKINNKDKCEYFAFEAFVDGDDEVATEKVITVVKNVFFSHWVELWVCWPKKLQHLFMKQR